MRKTPKRGSALALGLSRAVNAQVPDPRFGVLRFVVLHAKDAEAWFWDRRVECGRQAERERLSRLGWIENPIVPQPRRRVVGRAFVLVLVEDRLADRLFVRVAEWLALTRQLVALHRREDASRLFAAHHRDARIG